MECIVRGKSRSGARNKSEHKLDSMDCFHRLLTLPICQEKIQIAFCPHQNILLSFFASLHINTVDHSQSHSMCCQCCLRFCFWVQIEKNPVYLLWCPAAKCQLREMDWRCHFQCWRMYTLHFGHILYLSKCRSTEGIFTAGECIRCTWITLCTESTPCTLHILDESVHTLYPHAAFYEYGISKCILQTSCFCFIIANICNI